MLKITTRDYGNRTVFELEGKLAGPWVEEMKECWREAAAANRPVGVLLKQVSFIDNAGKALLSEMCRGGAKIEGAGCMTSVTVEEIKRGSKP
jgi:ABC-type transporter Mla MlaB component